MTTRGHATSTWVCLDTDGRPILTTVRFREQESRDAAVIVAAGGDHQPVRAILLLVGEAGWVPLGSTEITLRAQIADLLAQRADFEERLRRITELAQPVAPSDPA